MVEVVEWGAGWSKATGALRSAISEHEARSLFEQGRRVAALLRSDACERVFVEYQPADGSVRVDFLGLRGSQSRSASLRYGRVAPGHLGLQAVWVMEGKGEAVLWTQSLDLVGQRAVLDLPAEMVRHTLDLAGSEAHVRMRDRVFPEPGFGEYDALVRPGIVDDLLVSARSFDPDLPPGPGLDVPPAPRP